MPVFSSHLGKYDDLKLGQRVREERQTQKLTLGDVAQRTGLSIAKLSQMETGALVLDFETLVRIAGALGVAPDTLLPGVLVSTAADDFAPIESVQLQRFDGKEWVRFGEVMGGR